MREILFRGKRIDNGEWIEGYYRKLPAGTPVIHFTKNGHYYGEPVIPSTVGQYTGLTDMTGKKIFEGDIIQDTDQDAPVLLYTIIFKDGSFLAHEYGGIFGEDVYLNDFIAYEVFEGAVIGNIHDNPDLLEGE